MKLPLAGSPSARSMTLCDHRSTADRSALSSWRRSPRRIAPRSGSDRRATRGGPCFPMPAAMPRGSGPETRDRPPARPSRWPVTPCPRRRRTTPAIHRSGPQATLTWTRKAIPHNMVRGAMRIEARLGSTRAARRRSFGHAPNSSRAAAMSRLVAHVAARMCQRICGGQITGGLQMFGDQCGVLVDRSRSPDSMSAANRRCSSARSDLSCDS